MSWDQQRGPFKSMAGNFCFVVRIISFSLCNQLYFLVFVLKLSEESLNILKEMFA